MKAERRHELQRNTLALWLYDLPERLRKHGSKILLSVVALTLVVVLLVQWRSAKERAREAAVNKLVQAREFVQKLRDYPKSVYVENGMGLDTAAEARTLIEGVLKDTKDPRDRAEALTLLGDYHLTRAFYPKAEEGGAPVAESLNEAEKQYQAVVKELPDQVIYVTNARLGLAAVEETRAGMATRPGVGTAPAVSPNWANARQYYEAILKDGRVNAVQQALAKQKLEMVATLEKPVLIGPPAPPATQSSDAADTRPATGPATAPTSVPAAAPAPTTRVTVPIPAPAPTSTPAVTPLPTPRTRPAATPRTRPAATRPTTR